MKTRTLVAVVSLVVCSDLDRVALGGSGFGD